MRKSRSISEHDVEYSEQLSHAGGERHLGRFSGGTKSIIEDFNERIVVAGDQSRHEKRGTDLGSSSLDDALPPVSAAVTIHGSDADERGNLAPGKFSKLGKLSKQSMGGLFADARDGLEQILLFPPDGRRFDLSVDVVFERFDLLVEEGDGLFETGDDALGRGLLESIELGGADGDELSSTGHKGLDGLFGLVRERSRMRTDVVGEACDDGGVEGIGLGEPTGGAGEVSDLSGIDHGDGEVVSGEFGGDAGLIAAGGFHDHKLGLAVSGPGDDFADSLVVVGETTGFSGRQRVEVEGIFGHVDTDETCFGHFIPFLADTSSSRRLKRLFGLQADRPPGIQLPYGLEDHEANDLPAAVCPLFSPQQGGRKKTLRWTLFEAITPR